MATHLIQTADSIADLIEEDLVAPHLATQSVGADDEDYSEGEPEFTPRSAPKYVQAIVQAQQAHLVTNLVEGATRVLMQPQMVWTMGRNREAGMPIHDRLMSRRHAVLMGIFSGWEIQSFSSLSVRSSGCWRCCIRRFVIGC
jgi:hypothetical protein